MKPNQKEYWPGTVITERPILFQTDMVKAILEGRKTQTRRIIKNMPTGDQSLDLSDLYDHSPEYFYKICPYGKPGDLLWVREAWNTYSEYVSKPDYSVMGTEDFVYRADDNRVDKWKPSIHMPKAACRIWLMVEVVRVERLQEISERNAMDEGIEAVGYDDVDGTAWKDYLAKKGNYYPYYYSGKKSFKSLWVSMNGPESWETNPWVWVVKFRVLSTTGNPDVKLIREVYTDITSEVKEVSHG